MFRTHFKIWVKPKIQPLELFYKKGVLRNFAIFTGKRVCCSPFKIVLQAFRPVALLKGDSNTDAFLWNLQNFYQHLIWSLRTTASETCSFTLAAIFNNLTLMAQINTYVLVFVPYITVSTLDASIIRNSRTNLQNSQKKHQKRDSVTNVSQNTFFKEPFRQLLLYKPSFCLPSYNDFLPFQKRYHTYFLTEYFYCLNL